MFKRFPIWIAVTAGTFLLGVAGVILWLSSGRVERVSVPFCYHESTSFPGRSIKINDLGTSDRSAYSKSEFFVPIENKFLHAFDEKPFDAETLINIKANPDLAEADEIYRFFWLRTFHNPVLIRVQQLRGERSIVAKITDGKAGYDPGKLTQTVSRKLSDSEWCELIRRLDEARFWSKDKIDVDRLAEDGAFWIVEGVKAASGDRRYYVTGEQSPVEGSFRDACVYMMKLSGLHVDENSEDFY
jgi:hypothetical protein